MLQDCYTCRYCTWQILENTLFESFITREFGVFLVLKSAGKLLKCLYEPWGIPQYTTETNEQKNNTKFLAVFGTYKNMLNEKELGETQTLRTCCSNAEPKIFVPP